MILTRDKLQQIIDEEYSRAIERRREHLSEGAEGAEDVNDGVYDAIAELAVASFQDLLNVDDELIDERLDELADDLLSLLDDDEFQQLYHNLDYEKLLAAISAKHSAKSSMSEMDILDLTDEAINIAFGG
ncbi:MAG: hypothetical protein WCT13_05540 [Patescibacteria group bacterium]|jgi:hypothetical protein